MKVSVVIAALDEAQTIGDVVTAARCAAWVHEVVVVSDGSRDHTGTVARRAGADVVELPRNVGKAGAVMIGVERACGDVIVLLDADLIGLRPDHVENLLRPLLLDHTDMVIGVFGKDLMQTVLPWLSGQRAIRRTHLLRHPELRERGFALERGLAGIARRERWRVRTMQLTGLSHRLKEEKYGLVRGYRAKLKLAEDLIVQKGRVRPRKGRRTGLILMTVVVLAPILSGLFIAPTSAGHLDPMPAPAKSDRILLVAAHNDDELLAAGGYLARAVDAGSDVTVVILTNGDGNRFSAAVLGRRLRPGSQAFVREGELRQRESVAALGRLGIPRDRLIFMGFPDRGLNQLLGKHWSAAHPYTSPFTKASSPPYAGVYRRGSAYAGEELVGSLAAIVAASRPTIVLAHSALDEHADHQAASTFVTRALRQALGTDATGVRRYGFVIHAEGFPRPLRYAPTAVLIPPAHLRTQARWLTFDLAPAGVALKREAMRMYRSQYQSPYLRLLLSGFIRRNELFIEETDPGAQ